MKIPKWPTAKGMDGRAADVNDVRSVDQIKFGFERTKLFLSKLGNPEKNIPPVFHVAGTNGKGSITAFLKYMLQEQGYTTHRYTSPHLVNFNERIEIAGKEIADEYFDELAEECRKTILEHQLEASFFEIITAIAFLAFSRNRADAVILEVGLGGRLDATNVIDDPAAVIISSISYDHTHILGNTLKQIAMEKFGIVKPNRPIIMPGQRSETLKAIGAEAKKINCPIWGRNVSWRYDQIDNESCLYEGFGKKFKTPLPSLSGRHQIENAGTAISALLSQKILPISLDAIKSGLKKTEWRGRIQKIENTPLNKYIPPDAELYFDGAHNESGALALANWIAAENKKELRQNIIIVGILERKKSRGILRNLIKVADSIIAVDHINKYYDPNGNTLAPFKAAAAIKKECGSLGFTKAQAKESVIEALKSTVDQPRALKRITVCGSLYLIGDVLGLIDQGTAVFN
ncbi:MAG: bifunctional folylpolyglutamate synthase/dihydrofolate synthase [Rickettsiales bacterium]|jgi:dihydrofolate synthase/folylpolyglutamate synthase|nr:bifunctional folylpolyglutamate synthase/dihydrofolate synthase [Rickettsiales bacterium]